jgi:hypothetical protein
MVQLGESLVRSLRADGSLSLDFFAYTLVVGLLMPAYKA